jgi:hypothetical protein
MTGKYHTRQVTSQNKDFYQMLNDYFAGWYIPAFHFCIVGLEIVHFCPESIVLSLASATSSRF